MKETFMLGNISRSIPIRLPLSFRPHVISPPPVHLKDLPSSIQRFQYRLGSKQILTKGQIGFTSRTYSINHLTRFAGSTLSYTGLAALENSTSEKREFYLTLLNNLPALPWSDDAPHAYGTLLSAAQTENEQFLCLKLLADQKIALHHAIDYIPTDHISPTVWQNITGYMLSKSTNSNPLIHFLYANAYAHVSLDAKAKIRQCMQTYELFLLDKNPTDELLISLVEPINQGNAIAILTHQIIDNCDNTSETFNFFINQYSDKLIHFVIASMKTSALSVKPRISSNIMKAINKIIYHRHIDSSLKQQIIQYLSENQTPINFDDDSMLIDFLLRGGGMFFTFLSTEDKERVIKILQHAFLLGKNKQFSQEASNVFNHIAPFLTESQRKQILPNDNHIDFFLNQFPEIVSSLHYHELSPFLQRLRMATLNSQFNIATRLHVCLSDISLHLFTDSTIEKNDHELFDFLYAKLGSVFQKNVIKGLELSRKMYAHSTNEQKDKIIESIKKYLTVFTIRNHPEKITSILRQMFGVGNYEQDVQLYQMILGCYVAAKLGHLGSISDKTLTQMHYDITALPRKHATTY